VSAVDWSRWRKCPVCFAAIGAPCMSISGGFSHGHPYPVVEPVTVAADRPHSTRKPRTGGAK
jgi:hypothetical protein